MENGNLTVICDNGVYCLSGSGEQLAFVSLAGETLSCFSFSDNKTALVCERNLLGSVGRILVLDAQGREICSGIRENKVIGITASSGRECAYVLYENRVEVLSVAGSSSAPYSGQLLTVREIGGIPVLCYANRAESLYSLGFEEKGGSYESDS